MTGVSAAINDIVADGLEYFDCERFWPAHPLDGDFFGHKGFYYGATGTIWAIDCLSRVGTNERLDFRPFLTRLMDASSAEQPEFQDYAAHGSLLVGDLGTALMVIRLDPIPQSSTWSMRARRRHRHFG